MPDLGGYHPIVVHFAVALLVVGVALRLVSLLGRPRFASPAATLLVVLGTLAAVAAVQSGDDAHGPAERIPGASAAVHEHEEHGERARNVFLGMAALELVGCWLSWRQRESQAKAAFVLSLVVGLAGAFFLYEAAEHGGDVVYSYAGGVGTRSGDPHDVARLLTAGLYHQAQLERAGGRPQAAAELIRLLAERSPDNVEVALLHAESLLVDLGDGQAALDRLASFTPLPGTFTLRHGVLRAQALRALGRADEGRAILQGLASEFGDSRFLARALEAY